MTRAKRNSFNLFDKIKVIIKQTPISIYSFLKSALPVDYGTFSKTKKKFFIFLLFLFAFSIFGTVFFQSPQFVNKGINNAFAYIWIFVLFVILVFDYKKTIYGTFCSLLFFIPYFLYLLLSVLFGVSALSSALTRCVISSLLVLSIATSFGQLVTPKIKELFLFVYIFASFLLGLLIYFLDFCTSSLPPVPQFGKILFPRNNSSLPVHHFLFSALRVLCTFLYQSA